MGHVNHRKRRQKYYILTKKGQKETKNIKSNLINIEITIKELDGKTTIKPLGEIRKYINGLDIYTNITEMDIYASILKDCSLDINNLSKKQENRFVDYCSEAPIIHKFFGREKELLILRKWIEDKGQPKLYYIHGMAGIGKTTLASETLNKYHQQKHLFWHQVHASDTLRGVLLFF